MHLLDRKENRDVFPDRPIKKKKESDFSFGYVKRPCPKKRRNLTLKASEQSQMRRNGQDMQEVKMDLRNLERAHFYNPFQRE